MGNRGRAQPGGEFTALKERWESFCEDGVLDPATRPEIAASWRRSLESRITSEMESVPLNESALHGFDSSRQAQRQFLEASKSLADHLANELSGTNSAVIVCDHGGLLLYRTGEPDILRRTERLNFVPGGMWDEGSAGTNGIGLALTAGAASYVSSAEHYCEAFQEFSCVAAPVHHPVTREVLGAVDVTTDLSGAGSFAPALLTRAAREVELLMEEQVFGRERELLERYMRRRADRQAPFLTVDRAGHTIIQNARMLQAASPEDVEILLGLARSALRGEGDLREEVDLSRGLAVAGAQLVRQGSEVIGALVSIERRTRTREPRPGRDWSPLVGRSPAMKSLLDQASRVADRAVATIIDGQPGTGKMTLALAMHRVAGRPGEALVVNFAQPGWRERWRAGRAGAATLVLQRVQALGRGDQLELAAELDAPAPGHDTWLLTLTSAADPPLELELLHRLGRMTLPVPPLRDRGHDIELLVGDWCERHSTTASSPVTVRPEALDALAAQPWPGNVRELFNTLEAALVRRGSVIGVEALGLPAADLPPVPAGTLHEIERAAIEAALARNAGNVSRTARELGIGRATLQRRLRSYRLLAGAQA